MRHGIPSAIFEVIKDWEPREVAGFPMSLRDYLRAQAPDGASWEQAYWFGVATVVRGHYKNNGGIGTDELWMFPRDMFEDV